MSYAIVILVGGKGTRVSRLLKGRSKAEINISENKRIIDFQINNLLHLKKKIFFLSNIFNHSFKNYINKKYKNKFSFEIIEEDKVLGTSGCLKQLEKYHYKSYLIIDGDLIFNINFKKFLIFHKKKKSDCTLLVHPNNHPYDSDTVNIDNKSKVIKFYPKRRKNVYKNNLCLSGIKIINNSSLQIIKKNRNEDFSKDYLPKLIKSKRIFAYNTREYVKDAGTYNRVIQARKDIKSLKYKKGSLYTKIPAIFLDKDGVINKLIKKRHYQNPKKILPNVYKAIKKINDSGFLCVVITNQPAVAKGLIKENKLIKDLNELNSKLGKNNAYIDRIYYCPHHPSSGYSKEIKKLKIKCNCRKPKNGLFIRAINELNIDSNKSYMIGDSFSDYIAASKTKIKFIQVGDIKKFTKKYKKKIIIKKNLFSAVDYIL